MEFIISAPKSSIAFYIFNFPVRFYGITMGISIFCGFICTYFYLKKKYSLKEADLLIDYFPLLVIFSIFGARLFYVIGAFKYYVHNPTEIPLINHGGLSIWGAVIFGLISVYFLSLKYKFDIKKHLNSIALFMPLAQSIGRWGNYFNQEAFGSPTDRIIKLYVNRQYRPSEYIDTNYFHPAFLYESILDIVIFLALFIFFRNSKNYILVSAYIILYSLARIFTEFIRIDSVFNILNMPIAVIISLIMLLIGIAGFIYSLKKPS